jgi:hypothetical protein
MKHCTIGTVCAGTGTYLTTQVAPTELYVPSTRYRMKYLAQLMTRVNRMHCI